MTAILILMTIGLADEAAPSVLDLEGYRLAIAIDPKSPAISVRYRDLWDRPAEFAGRRVRVEGRVARLFRQPGIGEFPAMAEAWVVTPSGDPTCLVFPQKDYRIDVGTDINFAGTYLRRIRYRGGDVDRLAPLIVGPEPPSSEKISIPLSLPGTTSDWSIGLAGATVILLILARRHLSRPVGRPQIAEPAPRFLDSEPDPIENGSSHDQEA